MDTGADMRSGTGAGIYSRDGGRGPIPCPRPALFTSPTPTPAHSPRLHPPPPARPVYLPSLNLITINVKKKSYK